MLFEMNKMNLIFEIFANREEFNNTVLSPEWATNLLRIWAATYATEVNF